MNWPKKLDVTINYGENDQGESRREEASATLLRSVERYNEYGPMAEYQTSSGSRFWVVYELIEQCQKTKTLPDIPIEVITQNEEWLQKKAMGERALKQQASEQSGLILPPGYESKIPTA